MVHGLVIMELWPEGGFVLEGKAIQGPVFFRLLHCIGENGACGIP